MYTIECTAYILNNIVFDILRFLLPIKKDDVTIRNIINTKQIKDEYKEENNENKSSKSFINYFLLIN